MGLLLTSFCYFPKLKQQSAFYASQTKYKYINFLSKVFDFSLFYFSVNFRSFICWKSILLKTLNIYLVIVDLDILRI